MKCTPVEGEIAKSFYPEITDWSVAITISCGIGLFCGLVIGFLKTNRLRLTVLKFEKGTGYQPSHHSGPQTANSAAPGNTKMKKKKPSCWKRFRRNHKFQCSLLEFVAVCLKIGIVAVLYSELKERSKVDEWHLCEATGVPGSWMVLKEPLPDITPLSVTEYYSKYTMTKMAALYFNGDRLESLYLIVLLGTSLLYSGTAIGMALAKPPNSGKERIRKLQARYSNIAAIFLGMLFPRLAVIVVNESLQWQFANDFDASNYFLWYWITNVVAGITIAILIFGSNRRLLKGKYAVYGELLLKRLLAPLYRCVVFCLIGSSLGFVMFASTYVELLSITGKIVIKRQCKRQDQVTPDSDDEDESTSQFSLRRRALRELTIPKQMGIRRMLTDTSHVTRWGHKRKSLPPNSSGQKASARTTVSHNSDDGDRERNPTVATEEKTLV